jgi:hypothetical protein
VIKRIASSNTRRLYFFIVTEGHNHIEEARYGSDSHFWDTTDGTCVKSGRREKSQKELISRSDSLFQASRDGRGDACSLEG